MAPARIFYLISSLTQGGAERHLLELIRLLPPERFEPTICVLRPVVHYRAETPPGQPAYSLGRFWFLPTSFARLVTALRDCRPDLIHCYLNDGNLWGRLASQLAPSARLITSVHLDDMSGFYRRAERLLWPLSDQVVAHSESIRRLLVGELGLPGERVRVIANGVDTARFRPPSPAERAEARRTYDLGEDDFMALMPARICDQKNQLGVIEALAALRAQRRLPPSFRLFLAGRVSSRRVLETLRYKLWRHDLGGQVQWLGPVAEMQRLLWATDLGLLPSRTEASPIAALEAMASGLPMLITEPSNTDGVVIPGAHGWELPSENTAALAEALAEAIRAPRELRHAMGERGRAHVTQAFSAERVAGDFVRLYDELLGGPT
ncbi:MAG: glycosyltransferase [Deltaproteobacteria bacterium]|nr:glycosyltransferase [Deltaproteobacteria bacterium]